MNTFYINKTSETFSDTLVALGWSTLLRAVLSAINKPGQQILLRNGSRSRVSNAAISFEISLSCTLDEEELHGEQLIPFLEPLISSKQDERQGKKGRILQDGFFYDTEREKQRQLTGLLKQLSAERRTPEAYLRREPELEARLRDGPRPQLPHYQAINMMKIPDTFNEIVLRWRELTVAQQWQAIRLLYRLFSQPENDLDAAITDWKRLAKEQRLSGNAMVTAVQLINPTSGKGANAGKGNRLNSGGLESFWLLELLKFKGFLLGAAPYMLRGSKDRKTYVILPETVTLETLTSIMEQFRRICWSSTAIKQDILAALRLAQVLVHHRRDELSSGIGLEEWEEPPIVSITKGFDVAFYKDMGSAHATMNVSTINIPGWFPNVSELEQVDDAEQLLQEHIRIIRRIEGYQGKEGSNEIALLRSYRDFLSGHDLRPFLTFAALYGNYLFRQRDREKDVKRWLPQLTKKGLDRLIMSQANATTRQYTTILKQPGFQHIASAIREATVRAQRRSTQEGDNTYEVRYGLGQELMRKARNGDEFMNALNEFINSYNTETAREEEKQARRLQRALQAKDYKQYKLRYPVTTTDIEQLVQLLEEHPTEVVAKLLIAYGSCTFKPEAVQAADLEEDVENNQEEGKE